MFISAKLGLRNLGRNRWRSGLTLAAVGVAVGLMVWTLAMYEGWIGEMVRGATAVETTQVQVHTAAYVETPRVYRSMELDDGLLRRVLNLADVRAISKRVEASGLIGNEERSQVTRILGVDPAMEASATPVEEAITEGRWLSREPPEYPAPREVVLGQGLAQQLRVGTGAELVVFLQAADGSLGNELLRVVGIVRTGNMQIDRMAAYMHIADAQYLTALGDGFHELAIRTVDLDEARATADSVAAVLGARVGLPDSLAVGEGGDVARDALVVRPWQDIVPEIHAMILLFRQSYWWMYLLVYLVAAVGVVNTQRMSAQERRREFGVLIAIGMRPRRLFRTIVVETAVLGFIGALIGAVGGTLLSLYHVVYGFDMGVFTDQTGNFSWMGVAFSERLYFDLAPGHVIQPIVVMLAVALISGLWPAIKSARIEPAPTISGRQ